MSQKQKGTGRERSGQVLRRAVARLGRPQRLTASSSHPLLRCPGTRFTPNRKAAGLAFVLTKFPLRVPCGVVRWVV